MSSFERDYFEKRYRDYGLQNPGRKLAYYRSLVDRAAPASGPRRVLDFGCAFGLLLGSLGDGWQRCGIDASLWAIQRARERLPGVDFRRLEPGCYPDMEPHGVITAFDVLEHVPSLDECLAWIRRSLVVGGGFVFVVPVYDGPAGPVIRRLDHDPTHVHRESRSFWLRKTERLFEVVDWWGVLRYLLPGGCYLHVVTRRCRGWTPAIACLARRRE